MSCRLGKKTAHTAIHDIESLWWVLVYVIIRYSEPGAVSKEIPQELADFLARTFSDQDRKLEILENKKKELDDVLLQVGPYFEDLKDLIRDWHSILRIAFSTPEGVEFNYPHQPVLRCLDRAISKVSATSSQPPNKDFKAMEESVREERRKTSEQTKEAIRCQKTVAALSRSAVSFIPSSTTTHTSNAPTQTPTPSPPRKKQKKQTASL
jgi:hypothetical protein